jgi:hypothetical protein
MQLPTSGAGDITVVVREAPMAPSTRDKRIPKLPKVPPPERPVVHARRPRSSG